jgi:dipeptidyl aminopeptidase/acylaminoacyl peptidase
VVIPRPHGRRTGRGSAFRLENTKSDIAVIDLATRAVVRVTDDNVTDLVRCGRRPANGCTTARPGAAQRVARAPVAERPSEGPAEQLTTGAGNDVQPAVAPGTGRVAFTVLAVNSDLWRLPVSPATGQPTGQPEALIATTREDSRGAWSQDGRLVAFNSDRLRDMNIWIHDVATGRDRQLTRGPGGDYQPNWSPDGTRIAFFSARSGTNDIWTVDVATGALTPLAATSAMETNPSFSPDERRIAYQSDRTGRLEAWLVEADGSGAHQLTSVGVTGHFMRWSDDGRFLFVRSEAGTRERPVLRVDVATGVTEPALPGGSHLSFSPDRSLVLDVIGHRVLWAYRNGAPARRVYEFADPDSRIDYPVVAGRALGAVRPRLAAGRRRLGPGGEPHDTTRIHRGLVGAGAGGVRRRRAGGRDPHAWREGSHPRSTNLRGLDVTITANKEVYAVGEPIGLTLRVKNPTDVPILLRFASGQRYDFVIQSAAGEERWRWSAGRTFTQALGEQTVPQAWEMDYNERFVGRLPAGRYRIRGFVTAVGDTLEARAEVVVRR